MLMILPLLTIGFSTGTHVTPQEPCHISGRLHEINGILGETLKYFNGPHKNPYTDKLYYYCTFIIWWCIQQRKWNQCLSSNLGHGKCMNSSVFFSAIRKVVGQTEFLCSGEATSLGEEKLLIQTSFTLFKRLTLCHILLIVVG